MLGMAVHLCKPLVDISVKRLQEDAAFYSAHTDFFASNTKLCRQSHSLTPAMLENLGYASFAHRHTLDIYH